MGRYDTATKIVDGVLKELANRSGCDIEEIIDDSEIYTELKDELFNIVDDLIYEYDCEYRG